jgi:two-component sensor histidine kinase
VLDQEFDTAALAGLREAVLGYATACGMPGDRAIDVMLAVHELAANAVRHGPGHGQLRLHVTASTLRCEVSDPGPSSRDGRAGGTGGQAPGAVPWPVEQGHGPVARTYSRRPRSRDLRAARVADNSGVHPARRGRAPSAGPQAWRPRRRHRPLIHAPGPRRSLGASG